MPETTNQSNQLVTEVARLNAKFEAFQHLLEDMKKSVEVLAGENGLVTRVSLMQREIERHNEEFKEQREWRKWFSRVVFGAIVTLTISGLGTVIVLGLKGFFK